MPNYQLNSTVLNWGRVIRKLKDIGTSITGAKAEDDKNERASKSRYEGLVDKVKRILDEMKNSLNTVGPEITQLKNKKE